MVQERGEINEGRDVLNKRPQDEDAGGTNVSHSISPGLSYLSYLRPHISLGAIQLAIYSI